MGRKRKEKDTGNEYYGTTLCLCLKTAQSIPPKSFKNQEGRGTVVNKV
jgi:hypothetical protein